MNDLFYFGLTQKSAPLAIRDRLRADRDSQRAFLSRLSEFAGGRMVLATCERFEIYAASLCADRRIWTSFLASWFGLPPGCFENHVRTLSGPLVAEHLLRVAAGLDSRIVGERQILGQVRNAHETALEEGALDAQLSLLARTAIRAGKRVRQETQLDSGRSIVTMAMDWLADTRESICGKRVAVVGSGRLAGLVVSEVIQRRPQCVTITGRNESRAAELASHHAAQNAMMSALPQTVARSEIVFACTASPSYLIDSALIGEGRAAPLQITDLCVPRNVDPCVADLPFVTLSHLDQIVSHGLSVSRSGHTVPGSEAVKYAETIVGEELESFLRWQRERRTVPMIADLLSRAGAGAIGKRALHEQIMRLKSGVAV